MTQSTITFQSQTTGNGHMNFIDLPQMLAARGVMRLPGSKSISNRALLLAALAEGETDVRGLLASDDTARMLEALRALGVELVELERGHWRVQGCAGRIPVRRAELFLGNAGTAFRSLTAALALSGGDYVLKGVPYARASHWRFGRCPGAVGRGHSLSGQGGLSAAASQGTGSG